MLNQNNNPYDNSNLFNTSLSLKGAEGEQLIRDLYAELIGEGGLKGQERLIKIQLSCLLANIIDTYREDIERYVAFERAVSAWGESKYKVSRKVLEVVDALNCCGYLELKGGFRASTGYGQGRISRLRPTKELVDKYLQEKTYNISRNKPPIVLKDKDKKVISLDKVRRGNKRRLAEYEVGVVKYQYQLEKSDISLSPYAGVFKVNLYNKHIYRVFNNSSLEQGGRYHGAWWCNCPSGVREHILINGDETVELDYSCLHIHLLYVQKGLSPSADDAYAVEGYDRKLVKRCILLALNAGSVSEAHKGTKNDLQDDIQEHKKKGNMREEGILRGYVNKIAFLKDYKALIKAFLVEHPILEEFLYKGVGLKLQNTDSKIATYVINFLTEYNIPVLCIHDSFIVQKQFEDLLQELMAYAYHDLMFKDTEGQMTCPSILRPDKVERIPETLEEFSMWHLISRTTTVLDDGTLLLHDTQFVA